MSTPSLKVEWVPLDRLQFGLGQVPEHELDQLISLGAVRVF